MYCMLLYMIRDAVRPFYLFIFTGTTLLVLTNTKYIKRPLHVVNVTYLNIAKHIFVEHGDSQVPFNQIDIYKHVQLVLVLSYRNVFYEHE